MRVPTGLPCGREVELSDHREKLALVGHDSSVAHPVDIAHVAGCPGAKRCGACLSECPGRTLAGDACIHAEGLVQCMGGTWEGERRAIPPTIDDKASLTICK